MERGATKLEGGGQVKFYSYEKGDRKSFSHAEGRGGGTSFEVVLTQALEVLAILMGGGGVKSFHVLKGVGGHEKFYPVLMWGGGGTNSFRPAIFLFCSPPSP